MNPKLKRYLLITITLSWLIPAFLLILAPYLNITISLARYTPLAYLTIWSPAIAALTTIYTTQGPEATRQYLQRLKEPSNKRWLLLALLLPPTISLTSSTIIHLATGNGLTTPQITQNLIITTLLIATEGPIEELGWRGYALPILQKKYRPLTASLILGTIWGIWHIPAFLVSSIMTGTIQGSLISIIVRFIANTVITSIIMTTIYNATKGNIPTSMLYHAMLNIPYPWEAITGINPLQDPLGLIVIAIIYATTARKYLTDPYKHTEIT